jgi:type I restriction enzyme S subunit
MAKGNRIINSYEDDIWLSVFYEAVGTYVNIINNELGNSYEAEPLSNYIKIGGGYAFKTEQYKKTGVPIIRISDFNNEKIVLENCVFYDEDISLAKYELQANDIIICLTGGTIAKLGIVQEGLGKLYLNQRVGRFDIVKSDKFVKEYVYWIARSVQSIIKGLAWGAAIPNVSPKQIEKLKFSIPPIDIQTSIIDFLNDLKENSLSSKVYFDGKIEKHIISIHQSNIANKTLSKEFVNQLSLVKQLRQAFLSEAMQGKLCQSEPVEDQETGQQLLARIKAEKAQLIKDKKLKKEKELPPIKPEEIPFEIPEDWVWCRLGEIVLDLSYGTSEKAELSGQVPVLRMGNITTNGEILYSNLKYVSSSIPDLPKLYLKNGDLVFNRTNSYELVGKTGVFEHKQLYTLASYLIRVRFLDGINSRFVSNYINSTLCRKTQLEPKIIQQNGQANFNGTKLANILFPLSPLLIQNQIVVKLDELMKTCDDLENSIKQSQIQNEQLLQQVLKEALEVREEVVN